MEAARAAGAPIVPRGAGTGLSGGTIACADAIVVATRTSLVIVRGRDRRLAANRSQQAEVSGPAVRSIPLTSLPVAMPD